VAECSFCGREIPDGTYLYDVTEHAIYCYHSQTKMFTYVQDATAEEAKGMWQCSLEDAEIYCPKCVEMVRR